MKKSVLLGVTGGIAAYKSAYLCRLFVKEGFEVQVVMTKSACEFITPLTMRTLSGNPVHSAMFENRTADVEHIEMAKKADILVVAPATADYLARSAHGRASDLLSAVTLAFDGHVLAAPGMNTRMWQNEATQNNYKTLVKRGWSFVGPSSGELACKDVAKGRMAEPEEIFLRAKDLFSEDLKDLNILVTAGPTLEDLDPVRFISNRSSGQMGFAITQNAVTRGASVTLVTGPVSLPPVGGAEIINVRSALEMEKAVKKVKAKMDIIIMAAAVADYRPEKTSLHKIKKVKGENKKVLKLVRNPDILAGLGAKKDNDRQVLVGFALETRSLTKSAIKKMKLKGADIIVANLARDALETKVSKAVIFTKNNAKHSTGLLSKSDMAKLILDIAVKETGS